MQERTLVPTNGRAGAAAGGGANFVEQFFGTSACCKEAAAEELAEVTDPERSTATTSSR